MPSAPPSVLPAVTVVIPCRNDADLLRACLLSLTKQSLPPREIIVVDNNSTDTSADVARSFGARLVFEAVPGIPAAASAGYDAATFSEAAETGGVIARCDADCVLPPDWIARIAETFAADPALEVLSGPGVFYGMPQPLGNLAARLYLGSYYLAMGSALARWPVFGSNLAMRVGTWREISAQVHRSDAQMHDDVCLSFHLGPERSCRRDRSLVVGMAPRAVQSREGVALRFRRAFHTLRGHWPQEYPWLRWAKKIDTWKLGARA